MKKINSKKGYVASFAHSAKRQKERESFDDHLVESMNSPVVHLKKEDLKAIASHAKKRAKTYQSEVE